MSGKQFCSKLNGTCLCTVVGVSNRLPVNDKKGDSCWNVFIAILLPMTLEIKNMYGRQPKKLYHMRRGAHHTC